MTATHSNQVAPSAIHPFAYVQSTDPGAVGPNKGWLDTSAGPPYQLKRRNAGDSGWDLIGSGANIKARLRMSSNQSIATATATALSYDTEDADTDTQHFTSTAALTGTVAKSGTTAIVGTGTLFTTELTTGQVISVPGGGGTETRVVSVITDATHLTVSATFANTATGQTATRLASPLVFRTAGFYSVVAGIVWASSIVGSLYIRLNGVTNIGQGASNFSADVTQQAWAMYPFSQWDYVEAIVQQSSGSSVNVLADQRTFLASKL